MEKQRVLVISIIAISPIFLLVWQKATNVPGVLSPPEHIWWCGSVGMAQQPTWREQFILGRRAAPGRLTGNKGINDL